MTVKKKISGFWTVKFRLFFPVLKLTRHIEKVIKAMQKHHGNYYSLGRDMNLNRTKKKQHYNTFRGFLIPIRYPLIKATNPSIPQKPPVPTLTLLPKQIFTVIFFDVIFTLFWFFLCGSPSGRSRKKRGMVMDQEQAYEITFIYGQVSLWFYYICRLLCSYCMIFYLRSRTEIRHATCANFWIFW